jgi:hypothetical protein
MYVRNQQEMCVPFVLSRLRLMVGKVIWKSAKKMKGFKNQSKKLNEEVN